MAVSEVPETYVVVSGFPFQVTVGVVPLLLEDAKLAPVTVKVMPALPYPVLVGEIRLIEGGLINRF